MNIHFGRLVVVILFTTVALLGLCFDKVTLGEFIIINLLASINQNSIYK